MSKINFLNGWASKSNYFSRRSAQSYFVSNQSSFASSSCGAEEDPKPQPDPQPSSCGSSCGAGDGK